MLGFIAIMKQYKFIIGWAQVVNVTHLRKIYGLKMGPIPRIKHQQSTLTATITNQHSTVTGGESCPLVIYYVLIIFQEQVKLPNDLIFLT